MKAIILISEASLPLAKNTTKRVAGYPYLYQKTNAKAVFPSHPAIGS
mgnify:CR=1 FL=1